MAVGIAKIVVPLLGDVIDKVFGGKMAKNDIKKLKEEARREAEGNSFAKEMQELENDLKRDLAQVDVNKIEAASDDKFKSYWRPAVGWVCVSGLFYSFILRPFMNWVLILNEIPERLPALEMGTLIVLLTGMLGIGATRSIDKLNKWKHDEDEE